MDSLGCACNLIYELDNCVQNETIIEETRDQQASMYGETQYHQVLVDEETLNMEMPVDEEVTCSSNTSNDNELASKFYY